MRKLLPKHGETRIRYPFSFLRRRIDGYIIWFECYKVTECYSANTHQWDRVRTGLDDRVTLLTKKEEKEMGGYF